MTLRAIPKEDPMPDSTCDQDCRPDASALAGSDLHFQSPAGTRHDLHMPASIAALQAMVRSLPRSAAIVPRGGGLSYTAGVVASGPATVIDLTAIAHVEVMPADMLVRVGAGATWLQLTRELAPHGLRVPIAMPTSGLGSTVGGAVSQGLPGAMDAVLGLRVMLADGSIVTTGSAALSGRTPFNRNAGPDLTGIFIGDCGAFGLKIEVVLRLIRNPKTDFASFRFDDPVAMVAAMVDLQRELGQPSMGLDPVRTASAMKAMPAGDSVRMGWAAIRTAGSVAAALRAAADLLRTGANPGAQTGGWSLHLTAESPTEAGARAQIRAARARVNGAGNGASEIPAGIPRASRGGPFSLRGALGPDAERWLPVHGIVPLSRAEATMALLQDWAAGNAARMAAAGVFMAWLTTSRHGAVLFEPMLYWRDEVTPVHRHHLDPGLIARTEGRRAPPALRQLIDTLRQEICAILDGQGATHVQIGRYYGLAGDLDSPTLRLLQGIKRVTDPEGRMNPGVLGLPATGGQ